MISWNWRGDKRLYHQQVPTTLFDSNTNNERHLALRGSRTSAARNELAISQAACRYSLITPAEDLGLPNNACDAARTCVGDGWLLVENSVRPVGVVVGLGFGKDP